MHAHAGGIAYSVGQSGIHAILLVSSMYHGLVRIMHACRAAAGLRSGPRWHGVGTLSTPLSDAVPTSPWEQHNSKRLAWNVCMGDL